MVTENYVTYQNNKRTFHKNLNILHGNIKIIPVEKT